MLFSARLGWPIAIASLELLTPQLGLTAPLNRALAGTGTPAQSVPITPTFMAVAPHASPEAAAVEAEILAEINRLRTDPAAYADWLETQREYYQGTALRMPNEPGIQMIESETLMDAAIAALRAATPVPPLTRSPGLTQAARDHALDLRQRGGLAHAGSDGSRPNDRVGRYGTLTGAVLEQVNYGHRTGMGVVLHLVLADGDTTRDSRVQLLREDLALVGVGCMPEARLQFCVLDYAVDYVDNAETTVIPATDTANEPVAVNSPPAPPPIQAPVSTTPSPRASNTTAEGDPSAKPQPEMIATPTSEQTQPMPEPAARPSSPTTATIASEILSELEQAIIAETNRLRANPAVYAEELQALQPHYDGSKRYLPEQSAVLETEEGWPAVAEAIAVLQAQDPLPPLTHARGLSLGALDHALDMRDNNFTGHIGSDGSEPRDRVSRYGEYHDIVGENISYSPIATARWHVMMLVIDDGYPSRGHREALLRDEYRVMGAQCEPHAYGQACVMTYAAGFTDRAVD